MGMQFSLQSTAPFISIFLDKMKGNSASQFRKTNLHQGPAEVMKRGEWHQPILYAKRMTQWAMDCLVKILIMSLQWNIVGTKE